MDARFYTLNDQSINIENIARDLVNAYQAQGYQAQYIGNQDQVLVQFKKGGDIEKFIGMQASLSLTLQKSNNGVLASIGQQKWVDKAAVGVASFVIPTLWPLLLTAGLGVIRQSGLAGQVLAMLDGLIKQKYPTVQVTAMHG